MSNFLITLFAVVLAYLLGSIPFAVVSSRLFGLADPRSLRIEEPGSDQRTAERQQGAAAMTLS